MEGLVHSDRVADSSLTRLERFWGSRILNAPWAIPLLFGVVGLCCLLRAAIGLKGTQGFSHDVFALLDPAWRMLHGQRPHIDFYSHLGTLSFVPTLVGMWLAGGRAQGFGYGLALTGFLCSIWMYRIGRSRMPDVPLVAITLAVALMIVDPTSPGFSPLIFAPAMTYNRLGYALTAILLVETLLETSGSDRDRFWGGLSSGAIVGIFLFLKISYLAVSILLLAALYFCRPQARTRWIGAAIGLFSTSLLGVLYLRFDLLAVARDLYVVAASKHINLNFYFLETIFFAAGIMLVLCMMTGSLLRHRILRGYPQFGLATALVVCSAGGILIFGNYEPTGFPLLRFFALICVTALVMQSDTQSQPDSTNSFRQAVLLLASICIVVPFGSELVGFGNALYQRIVMVPKERPLEGALLYGFVPTTDAFYTSQVNDGVELLRKHRIKNETIMCLDFTNPFSVAMQAPPSRGGAVTLQYGTTFSDLHRPSPERLFNGADLVMVPKPGFDPSWTESLPRLYGPYLESYYRKVGDSRLWWLYRISARTNESTSD